MIEKNNQENKKYYTIGSVRKVCTMLEMLSQKKSWKLVTLQKAMNLPKTTVHRMLLTLEDEGFVTQERHGGTYSLSYKLFSLARKMANYSNISDVVRPYCIELLNEFDETVNLCIPSDIDMLVLDKQITTQILRPENIVGSSFPMLNSGSGMAYLAFCQKERCIVLLENIRTKTKPFITDQEYKIFLERLEKLKKIGISYDYEEMYSGVRCIGVPIIDINNIAIATISISLPTVRFNKEITEKLEKGLLDTGKRISLELGTSHPLYLP